MLTSFVRVIKNISLFYFDEFVGVVFVIGVALPANNVLLTSIVWIVMFFPIIPVALIGVVVFDIDTFVDGLICAKIGCCRSSTTYTRIISPIAKGNANNMDLFTLIDIVECTAQINFNFFSLMANVQQQLAVLVAL
jgi:hypothetical protein